jgi:hypothetical protein
MLSERFPRYVERPVRWAGNAREGGTPDATDENSHVLLAVAFDRGRDGAALVATHADERHPHGHLV